MACWTVTGGILHLLRVQCMLLCMACHATTGMGNRLWDQMTTAGVVGDDQVTCTGHGQHDTLGEQDTWVNAWKCNRSGIQKCLGV